MDLVRRGSLVLSTAPTNIPHPWKVEWARGEKFRCFLGRIYDPEVMATDEWEPERFPEGLSQGMIVTKHTIQRKYLKKDRTAMNSKAYATSIKSGSVKVYTKASFGRVTYATSVLIDEEKGCAEWDESVILAQSAASVYFVLHKTTNRWMVSAVLEADVTASDIKLAVVKKRESASVKDWRLIQLWKSDLFIEILPPEPFTVEVTGGAADGKVYCAQGNVTSVAGSWSGQNYMQSYLVQGFAIFPTSSMIWGNNYTGNWVSDKGNIAIANAANGGCDTWEVCLVSNSDFNSFGVNVPYLAVMATGSDADTKTTPWGAHNGMTLGQKITTICVGSKSYEPDAVQAFEGSPSPLPLLECVSKVELTEHLSSFECQRVLIASVYWDSASSSWLVSQYHQGDLFQPQMIQNITSIYQYEDSPLGVPFIPPDPLNSGQNTAWFGPYTGYTKEVSYPTTTPI